MDILDKFTLSKLGMVIVIGEFFPSVMLIIMVAFEPPHNLAQNLGNFGMSKYAHRMLHPFWLQGLAQFCLNFIKGANLQRPLADMT